MNMTKREIREALGFTMDKELAEFFGIGKAAVSAWGEDEPIPAGRVYQAMVLKPAAFGLAAKRRKRAA